MRIRQIRTDNYVLNQGYAYAYRNDRSKLMIPGGGSHLTCVRPGMAR